MAEVADDIKQLGDKIVGLTLKQAVDLATYLKEAHGIEPAAGAPVMMAGPGGPGGAAPAEAAEEKSTFDVVLKSGGEKKIPRNSIFSSAFFSSRIIRAIVAMEALP